jgi:hypothetical protein
MNPAAIWLIYIAKTRGVLFCDSFRKKYSYYYQNHEKIMAAIINSGLNSMVLDAKSAPLIKHKDDWKLFTGLNIQSG